MIAWFLIIASGTASLTDAPFGSGSAEDEEPVQNGGPSSATFEHAKLFQHSFSGSEREYIEQNNRKIYKISQ